MNLPNTLKYDSHNRLVEYIISGPPSRKVKLYYDPIGRIFRKESYTGMALDSATNYYYSGGNLIQEFDEMYVYKGDPPVLVTKDELTWDYLRGLGGQVVRRRKRNGVNDYTDMLHFNDMMGTAREEVNPTEVGSEVQGSAYGYVTTADGEPLSFGPSADLEENHIQFHGGFLEDRDFHESFDRGYFYRMGIRHYSPGLGRFLQRDPFSYSRAPHKSNPISLNPYEYALNRPTQLSDRSGYQACPGCASPFGGAAPIGMLPSGGGMGTDTGAPGGDPGGGPDLPDTVVNRCLRPYPAECIDDERYPDQCRPICCQYSDDQCPYCRWTGMCCGDWAFMDPTLCKTSNEENCECACCWAPGEENAPSPIDGGGFRGSTWIKPHFGPPSIGPWGDGGIPWGFGPVPPWWWARPLDVVPANSIYGNGALKSNLLDRYSQSSLMVLPWAIIWGIGTLSGAIAFGVAVGIGVFCDLSVGSDCCLYDACCAFNKCTSNWLKWIIPAGAGIAAGYYGIIGAAGTATPLWGISGYATAALLIPCIVQFFIDASECEGSPSFVDISRYGHNPYFHP